MKKNAIRAAAISCGLALLFGCSAVNQNPTDAPDSPSNTILTATATSTQTPEPTAAPTPESTVAPAPVQPDLPSNIEFGEGQNYAVAYLGYQDTGELESYIREYSLDAELPVYYISDGDFYLVIPRYADTSLKLFVNDIETGDGRLFAEVPDCGAFIVQCNASDIFADATIRLEYDGGTSEFSPFISLMDGTLDIGDGLDVTGSVDAARVE